MPASRKLGKKDASAMARSASQIDVAKGKKTGEFAGAQAKAATITAMLGPTGNLRARTASLGNGLGGAFPQEQCTLSSTAAVNSSRVAAPPRSWVWWRESASTSCTASSMRCAASSSAR